MIKERMQKWLGIWDLEVRCSVLEARAMKYVARIGALERRIVVQDEAIKRAIAQKFDPRPDAEPTVTEYSTPGDYMKAKQQWDERKAESDKLADETFKRLKAEDEARRHSLGEC